MGILTGINLGNEDERSTALDVIHVLVHLSDNIPNCMERGKTE